MFWNICINFIRGVFNECIEGRYWFIYLTFEKYQNFKLEYKCFFEVTFEQYSHRKCRKIPHIFGLIFLPVRLTYPFSSICLPIWIFLESYLFLYLLETAKGIAKGNRGTRTRTNRKAWWCFNSLSFYIKICEHKMQWVLGCSFLFRNVFDSQFINFVYSFNH